MAGIYLLHEKSEAIPSPQLILAESNDSPHYQLEWCSDSNLFGEESFSPENADWTRWCDDNAQMDRQMRVGSNIGNLTQVLNWW